MVLASRGGSRRWIWHSLLQTQGLKSSKTARLSRRQRRLSFSGSRTAGSPRTRTIYPPCRSLSVLVVLKTLLIKGPTTEPFQSGHVKVTRV